MKGSLGYYRFILFWLVLVSTQVSAESFKWLQQPSAQNSGDVERIYYYDDAIYAVGRTGCIDADCSGLLAKYTLGGEILWRRDFKLYADTEAFDITVDEHGVFVVGRSAEGPSSRSRAFVAQYTHDGNAGWQYTNEVDSHSAWTITHDSKGLYVTSEYNFDGGIQLLSHLDFDGNLVWTTQVASVFVYRAIAADNKIYLSNGNKMSVFSTDGTALYEFPFDRIEEMVYDNGFFYCISRDTVFKIDELGNTVWEQTFFKKVRHTRIVDITLGKNGIWVAGFTNHTPEPDVGKENGIRLVEYNLRGQFKNDWFLPDAGTPIPSSVVFNNGNLYLGGTDFHGDTGFVAQTSELDLLQAQVRSLSDADGDGYQDLVVLSNDLGSGRVLANVKSIGSTTGLDHQIQFTTALRPVDFAITPDLNANLSPELAVVSAFDGTVEVRDSLSGALISAVPFDTRFLPSKLRVLPDENTNGTPELAVLETHQSKSRVQIEIRDSVTTALIAKIPFNPTFNPKDFTLLQDINGDSISDFALLSTSPESQFSKLEIRDKGGVLIKNVWLGDTYDSSQIIPLPPTLDSQASSATEVAVLQAKLNGAGVRVAIADPLAGNVVRTIGFNESFDSITARAIADVDGNGAPELAVFGKSTLDGQNKVEIRDSLSGELIGNLWNWKSLTPMDITVIPDVNGNSEPEIGIFSGEAADNDPEDFDFTVLIKDTLTGQKLDQIDIHL
ncbi:hypothetical protein FT643_18930 [Ketobacter sp. MCCC 1A13808]|uniref:hypothetical protein n=1 Tax=Ketobacter sp. MCCC 1A13808 TaxID=2602738 RepID=UPI0012EBE19C|nr:hypothetical protein [Ketobacter sp. MCCC 1A13808]MVF14217.1 hypothetical protein [Ketobacter sp. MCCC 1A13808]